MTAKELYQKAVELRDDLLEYTSPVESKTGNSLGAADEYLCIVIRRLAEAATIERNEL